MIARMSYVYLAWLAACLVFAGMALAQNSSGTISGRVMDTTGQVIVGAEVALVNQDTGDTRNFTTDQAGEFVFTSIQPGAFNLTVKAKGFKQYEKTGLVLSSFERLSAGDLKLQVGSVSESIEVKAEIAPVQIASTERSELLDSKQITDLMARGRDPMALLVILPGVVTDSEGNDSLGVFNSPTMQGVRNLYNSMNIDGVSGVTRSGDKLDTPINMDAVGEIKVLTSNYQAEYGKASGSIINITTKSGSRNFHGLAYYYNRNEAFNANSFFNNRAAPYIPRQRYRYNTLGYNLGGPITWPGRFNTNKEKLFFFFSQEILPNQQPNGPRNFTVPTGLERKGDFSQSLDSSNKLITIKDPFNGGAAFPGNLIPANRINTDMQKLLGIFPMPNVFDRTVSKGQYNFQIADVLERPVMQEILRVDYNISPKWRAYFRGMDMDVNNKGPASTANQMTWGIPVNYKTTGPQVGGNVTYVISPTLINELTVGYAIWTENQIIADSDLARIQKDKLGIKLGQIYPKNNPLNLLPTVSWSSEVPSAARVNYDGRFPMSSDSSSWSFSDGLSKVRKAHLFKAGVQYEFVVYNQYHNAGSANFPGSFNFGRTSNNALDTNHSYANALLGVFQQYTETTGRADYEPVTRAFEWYVQDTWRAAPRLTIDYGVRFTYGLPQYPRNNQAASFVPSLWNPAKAPALYRPALDAKKARVAQNPLTGELLPAVFIGLLVPGSGDPANGIMVSGTPGYPRALADNMGILPAPRVGLSWNVFGDGKTALRTGFGWNFNPRNGPGIFGDLSFNPPLIYNPTQYYGQLSNFLDAGNTIGPSSFKHSLDRNMKPVSAYNVSFGIQRNIGFSSVLDVSYVGSFGRHIGQTHDINMLKPGIKFQPQSLDATNSNKPLPDNFLRNYPGYAGIPYLTWDSNASYHSLQAQLRRRFTHGLQYGAAFTWARAMSYTNGDKDSVATYISPKVSNYGAAGYDRTLTLTFHYLYDFPKASKLWNTPVIRHVFDNWQISGITRMVTGAPFDVSASLSDSTDLTGGGDGWRPVMLGAPILPRGQRTFEHYFNTAAFGRPPAGSIGNAPSSVIRGPGINNWNASLFKNIKVREKLKAQFRAEAYNTFNHSQFSSLDVSPKFDPQGNNTNAQFGQLTAARSPRIMQFALRLSF